jgi:hypothetical protein
MSTNHIEWLRLSAVRNVSASERRLLRAYPRLAFLNVVFGHMLLLMAAAVEASPPEPPTLTELDGQPIRAVASIHDFTGLPMTADGWTDLEAIINSDGYSDARIVYVSNSGNDSTAQRYNRNSAELGGRPLNPTGNIASYATIAAAYQQLRSGYPDVMLLKRGDSWGTSLTIIKKGRNASERMIVAAYGPESAPRPTVTRIDTQMYGAVAEFLILSSVENNMPNYGIWYSGRHVLVEDFRWNGQVEGASEVLLALIEQGNSAVRRSTGYWALFFSGWNQDTNPSTQGLVEENTLANSPSSGFRHNVYFGEGGFGFISIGNQSIESGGAGWRQRGGGVVHRNLLVGYNSKHPNGLAGGFDLHQDIDAQYNVVLHAGQSLSITAMLNATYDNNIITAQDRGYGHIDFHTQYSSQPSGHRGNNSISNNIIHGAVGSGSVPINSTVVNSMASGATLAITGNDLVRNGSGTIMPGTAGTGVTYADNRYHSTSPTSNWFSNRTYDQMIPSTGTAITPAVYPDPNRNILTYMQSLGANPANWRQAMEWYKTGVPGNPDLAGAINNRRGAWDNRFTADAVIKYIREGFGLDY